MTVTNCNSDMRKGTWNFPREKTYLMFFIIDFYSNNNNDSVFLLIIINCSPKSLGVKKERRSVKEAEEAQRNEGRVR